MARRLFRLLNERPGNYSLSEVLQECRTSKAGLMRAAQELIDNNVIVQEED